VRYEFYPPHGHPDHHCKTALRLLMRELGLPGDDPVLLAAMLENVTQLCANHAHLLDSGFVLGGVVLIRGESAREWNRDDPDTLRAVLAGLRRKVPGQRQQAQWN
jgi:hypothetical protein